MAIIRRLPHRPVIPLFLCFLLFEFFYFPIRDAQAEKALTAFADGETITLCGTLYKKEYKNETYRYFIKHLSIFNDSFYGKALVLTDSNEYPVGTILEITGQVSDFSLPENDGGFDERTYYKGQGIFLRLRNPSFTVKGRTALSPFWEGIDGIKQGMLAYYSDVLPMEEAGILSAMTLGDRAAMDEDAKTLFQEAGMAHILAVSGLHISIVGMGLFRLLKKSGIGYLPCGVISLVFVVCYGVMTGLSVSTLRAILMFGVMMLSMVLGDAYDMPSSLLVALMIVLFIEPMAPFCSGFLFSFGAVFGITLCAAPLTDTYEVLCKKRFAHTLRYRKGKSYRPTFKEKFMKGILFSLGIQMFTIPLVAWFYYEIPIYVVGLNLILIPLLSVLIGVGLFGGFLGALFGAGGWVLFPCHLFLYFYEMASDASLHLPYARVTVGHPAVWRVVLYYGLLMVFVWGMNGAVCKKGVSMWAFFCGTVGGGMLLFSILAIPPASHTQVHMLSVGQGDGIAVFSIEGGCFFIDGGSTSKKNVGKYVIRPFLAYHGKAGVDYWLLSHLDEDHISGCVELLEDGYRIKNLVLAETLKTEEDAGTKEKLEYLLFLCESNDTNVLYMKGGDACGTASLTFYCLAPDFPSEFSGANENSMVLKMTYEDLDILFTGDIGEEQEKALVEKYGGKDNALDGVEILKSAHHGSNGSNCKEWLSEVAPSLCIISAGKNNRYGHPGREAVARMDEVGISHICTIDTGQISMEFEKGKVSVEKYVK